MKEVTMEDLIKRVARDMKDKAEAARREEKARTRHARETRQARLFAKQELGFGSW
jgi:hypothetical protein